MLVVVHGYQLLMPMRRVPRSVDRYRFLGLCYVHGFMDGEAVERNDVVTEHAVVA